MAARWYASAPQGQVRPEGEIGKVVPRATSRSRRCRGQEHSMGRGHAGIEDGFVGSPDPMNFVTDRSLETRSRSRRCSRCRGNRPCGSNSIAWSHRDKLRRTGPGSSCRLRHLRYLLPRRHRRRQNRGNSPLDSRSSHSDTRLHSRGRSRMLRGERTICRHSTPSRHRSEYHRRRSHRCRAPRTTSSRPHTPRA
jgi:hypothetical protein